MNMLLLNPKRKSTVKKGATMHKRKSAHKVKRAHHKRRNPRSVATVSAAPVHHRRKRRNPTAISTVAKRRVKRRFGSSARGLVPAAKQTIMQGAIAGLGAVGADLVAAQLMKYLPDSLKTVQMQPFAQVGVSLFAGFIIGKVNKKAGDAVAFGGVTVATYNLSKSLLIKAGIPGLSGYSNLQGYDYDPAYGVSAYDPGLRSVMNNNPLAEYTGGGGMFSNGRGDGMGMYDNTYGVN